MKNQSVVLVFFASVSQVWTLELEQALVAPYSNMLQENTAGTQLQRQMNASATSIIQNMASYDAYMTNIARQILAEHHTNIQAKVAQFKSSLRTTQSRSTGYINQANSVVKCLVEEGKLDVLADDINTQIKKCATVAMAEMVNVISDSLNEAQTFMSIPQVIGTDIQRCGLSYSCRWDIVGDAIAEALQVPPKVFALTAKIQSIALRTVVSIDSCGLQGLRRIAETGISVLEGIFRCINDEINSAAEISRNSTAVNSIS